MHTIGKDRMKKMLLIVYLCFFSNNALSDKTNNNEFTSESKGGLSWHIYERTIQQSINRENIGSSEKSVGELRFG